MTNGQIIITGGSRGLGAAIALELDRRGADVVCLSRSGEAPAGRGMICDMSDENDVRRVFADIGRSGPVAGLVNNAGMERAMPADRLTTELYDQIMNLNARAVMVASREAYPLFKARGSGRIVNMGSMFDRLGVKGHIPYCASKAAVAAITRCLAVEWAADNISVVNVAPGYVETDLNRDFLNKESVRTWIGKRVPLGRTGRPEEVARLVSVLLLEEFPFLTGETIHMDGGQTINP